MYSIFDLVDIDNLSEEEYELYHYLKNLDDEEETEQKSEEELLDEILESSVPE